MLPESTGSAYGLGSWACWSPQLHRAALRQPSPCVGNPAQQQWAGEVMP